MIQNMQRTVRTQNRNKSHQYKNINEKSEHIPDKIHRWKPFIGGNIS